MQPTTGSRIGRYELLRLLCSGAMGEVCLARDQNLGREVAIKFLPERFAADSARMIPYGRLGRAADAEATYQKTLVLQPDSWITRSCFGAYLANHGRPAEAEQQYKEALKSVPDNARLGPGSAPPVISSRNIWRQRMHGEKSLELHPTSKAASNLALRPFYEGRYEEAALRFEQALKIDDRDYRVWRNLASAYCWLPGGSERAAKAFRQAVVLAEKAPRTCLWQST